MNTFTVALSGKSYWNCEFVLSFGSRPARYRCSSRQTRRSATTKLSLSIGSSKKIGYFGLTLVTIVWPLSPGPQREARRVSRGSPSVLARRRATSVPRHTWTLQISDPDAQGTWGGPVTGQVMIDNPADDLKFTAELRKNDYRSRGSKTAHENRDFQQRAVTIASPPLPNPTPSLGSSSSPLQVVVVITNYLPIRPRRGAASLPPGRRYAAR
ncbi:hypothetical protein Bbelb_417460 [Branchiostoma belcheri]|nr:hypothetical protein Bbelb_417460 [Branchiostoma belcheri]